MAAINELPSNEIRWDYNTDIGLLVLDKFNNIIKLIEEKMNGRSGLVWVSSHNYLLFAVSTTGNFSLDPRIKFPNGSYWIIVQNSRLDKDEIRVFPD